MSMIALEVIGREENSNEEYRTVVKVNKRNFRDETGVAPNLENIRRKVIADFLESSRIVSKINVLTVKS